MDLAGNAGYYAVKGCAGEPWVERSEMSPAEMFRAEMEGSTNGTSPLIWQTWTMPTNGSPVLVRNPKAWINRYAGFTAISQCNTTGGSAQLPLTAVTKRHAITRGHGFQTEGVAGPIPGAAGIKVYFSTETSELVERTVVGAYGIQIPPNDYGIVIFDADLPDSIKPMALIPLQRFYDIPAEWGWTAQSCQHGYAAPREMMQRIPHDQCVPGDSGSPKFVLHNGRLWLWGLCGCGEIGTPEFVAAMNALTVAQGLDPKRYQLTWMP